MHPPRIHNPRVPVAVKVVCFLLLTWVSSAQPFRAPRPETQGPWNRDLLMRWSTDGNIFGPEGVFTETAGVPSLTRSRDGRLLAVFQWFPLQHQNAFDRVAVRFSDRTGTRWSAPVPIQVFGFPSDFQRPFDPTIVTLPDGRYRLYFSSNQLWPHERPGTEMIATHSAVSTDGLSFTYEAGARFSVPGRRVIDCAVAPLGKRWLYAAPVGRPEEGAYCAWSADGLTFTRLADIPSVGGANWTGNFTEWAEGLRFYGSSARGLWWSQSRDGATWSVPISVGVRGGDPAVVQTVEGRYLLVYVSEPRRNIPHPFRKPPPVRGAQMLRPQ